MTEWAIGSLAAYNALPAATQARFAARYDTIFSPGDALASLEALTEASGLMPDSYSFVYIADVTETTDVGGPGNDIRNYNTFPASPPARTWEITALTRSIVVTATKQLYFHTYYDGTNQNNRCHVELHGFTIKGNYASVNPGAVTCSVRGMGKYDTHSVHDMTFWSAHATARYNAGLRVEGNIFQTIEIYNCVAYNCYYGFEFDDIANWGGASEGLHLAVENCDTHACGVGFQAGFTADAGDFVNGNMRGCCSFGSLIQPGPGALIGDYGARLLLTAMTFQNCADGDGSAIGANPQHNIVPAEEFQSLVYGDAGYLRLKIGTVDASSGAVPTKGMAPLEVQFNGAIDLIPPAGVLGTSGTEPTIAGDTDFDGNARPGLDEKYAIGAFEQTYLFPSGQVLS